MNLSDSKQAVLLDTEDMDEIVLHTAASIDGESLAPEETTGTDDITTWDESSDATGQQKLEMPPETDETIAEQLVSAGNEEADFEHRVAAGA